MAFIIVNQESRNVFDINNTVYYIKKKLIISKQKFFMDISLILLKLVLNVDVSTMDLKILSNGTLNGIVRLK